MVRARARACGKVVAGDTDARTHTEALIGSVETELAPNKQTRRRCGV